MLLTIQNIQKYFGAELCLRNISCVLDAQDRAGIIGENGAGKTTLIKIITGELYPDDGIVTLAHGATIGYLEQNSVLDPACTVYGEMENAFRSVLDAMDEMKRLERQMAECPGDHMLLEHHHIICTQCGCFADAPASGSAALDEAVARQTGYSGVSHDIVFRGLCPECAKAGKV